jgi:type VI secretion system secreted protein Hcp
MAAYLKLAGIDGEATDKAHDKWIIIEAMSSPIFRSNPQGAKDQQRMRGETTLGDVSVVRELDKSSVKLQEACANGTLFPEVEIHFTSQLGDKQETYLKYKLKDVIITSYAFQGNSSGQPLPTEQVTMGYTEAEWTYITLDPKTGDRKGQVVGKFNPGKGASA